MHYAFEYATPCAKYLVRNLWHTCCCFDGLHYFYYWTRKKIVCNYLQCLCTFPWHFVVKSFANADTNSTATEVRRWNKWKHKNLCCWIFAKRMEWAYNQRMQSFIHAELQSIVRFFCHIKCPENFHHRNVSLQRKKICLFHECCVLCTVYGFKNM